MSDSVASEKKKRRKSNWILWWRISDRDLRWQVVDYATLKINQSMRGIGSLLLGLSAVLSAGLIELFSHNRLGYVDVAIFVAIGFFVYRGHRWAMIAAMILWTVEKAVQVATSFVVPFMILPALIWWALYMHVFYFAFKIEQARRQPHVDLAATFE